MRLRRESCMNPMNPMNAPRPASSLPSSNRKGWGSLLSKAWCLIVLTCIILFIAEVHMTTNMINTDDGKRLMVPSPPQANRLITVNPTNENRTLHMIYCLLGNNERCFDEWEVSFKSMIFNAPLDANLHIHIICNDDALTEVKERISKAGLIGSAVWRNEIFTTVTVISKSKEENLYNFLGDMVLKETHGQKGRWIDKRLGLGAFLRLFAYKYIQEYVPMSAESNLMAYYLDIDIVIMSNLNNVLTMTDTMWETVKQNKKPTPLCFWGDTNSGFLGVNIPKFDAFWKAVSICKSIKEDEWKKKNDQWLLGLVSKCFSKIFADQPRDSPWSVHIGHGYRQRPQKLDSRPSVGMMHMQKPGERSWFVSPHNTTKHFIDWFCTRSPGCNNTDRERNLELVRRTWGIADYYVRLSWDWVKFQAGESRKHLSETGGRSFVLNIREGLSNFSSVMNIDDSTLNEYI